jgi:deoxycytidine triphosphate deaminase
MEIRNATRHTPLRLECGMRIAQIVVHQLDQPAVRPCRDRLEGTPSRARAAGLSR